MKADHHPPWGLVLAITWLLLGCIAMTPWLGIWRENPLVGLCMLPTLLISGMASQIFPPLAAGGNLAVSGHGEPVPTQRAIFLVHFIPATLGIFRFLCSVNSRRKPRTRKTDGPR